MAEFLINNEPSIFPIVHLTSDSSSNSQAKRAKQLETLFALTKNYNTCVCAGDFNFGDGEENEGVNWGELKDTWKLLKNEEDGFTYDPEKNGLAKITSLTGRSRRLDRVIFRSPYLDPKKVQLIGTNSYLVKDNVQVHPSDHYGLFVEFSLDLKK